MNHVEIDLSDSSLCVQLLGLGKDFVNGWVESTVPVIIVCLLPPGLEGQQQLVVCVYWHDTGLLSDDGHHS